MYDFSRTGLPGPRTNPRGRGSPPAPSPNNPTPVSCTVGVVGESGKVRTGGSSGRRRFETDPKGSNSRLVYLCTDLNK